MHTHAQAGPPAIFKEPVHANASWNETIELAKKKGLQAQTDGAASRKNPSVPFGSGAQGMRGARRDSVLYFLILESRSDWANPSQQETSANGCWFGPGDGCWLFCGTTSCVGWQWSSACGEHISGFELNCACQCGFFDVCSFTWPATTSESF